MADKPRIEPHNRRAEDIPLALIDPDPGNYNDHPPEQVTAIAASLQEFGQPKPVVVQATAAGRYILAAGHGVRLGAQEAGWETVWATVIPAEWSRERVRAFLVADNRLAEMGQTNEPALASLLREIAAYDAQLLPVTGYTADEADELVRRVLAGEQAENVDDAGPEIDRAEELRQKWQTEPGQLWQLGDHRLICGDCTDPAVVARVMGGERAQLVVTDPPYNLASNNTLIANDVSKSIELLKSSEWDRNFDVAPVLDIMSDNMDDAATVYIFSSHHLIGEIWDWMKGWASHYSFCVWHKTNPMPSLTKRHWTWDTELVAYGRKEQYTWVEDAQLVAYATTSGHVFNFPETGHAPSVWSFSKSKETTHPTEKPVEVICHPIRHSSNKGYCVFDPFSGSGTTIIACETLARRARAIEISPAYVALALERYQQATGKTPELIK